VGEWRRGGFLVTDDRARVDLDVVHGYLSGESYWAKGRARSVTETAAAASWCFSLIDEESGAQVGFARLVTDHATFGWLADVFVLPAYQARGLGHFLVACVIEAASEVRRLFLGTRDAHGVYADLGFTAVGYPDRLMEILREPLAP
jgi:N-acetylglutamate synthase-like GNAT family acetyltransferase